MKKSLYALMAALAVTCMMAAVSFAAGEYTVTGKVVSIDPTGRTVVIDTAEGQKTVNFQAETTGFTDVRPGMSVEMTCIDQEGKACAKNVEVISVEGSGMATKTFEGEVVSIDPEGKTVVIKNPAGEEMTIKMTSPTAEVVKAVPGAASTSEMLSCEAIPIKMITRGTYLKADCFDAGGKFCANRVYVISPDLKGKLPMESVVTGEVVSIDPAGKSVVIKTSAGEKTIYYQNTTRGTALGEIAVGSEVKANCLDVEGKTCIRNIMITK